MILYANNDAHMIRTNDEVVPSYNTQMANHFVNCTRTKFGAPDPVVAACCIENDQNFHADASVSHRAKSISWCCCITRPRTKPNHVDHYYRTLDQCREFSRSTSFNVGRLGFGHEPASLDQGLANRVSNRNPYLVQSRITCDTSKRPMFLMSFRMLF
ncbi:hypothetical protein TanjilG_24526 [Lupinus angustifolius]|uniref:Uncharacterized protein n=1 Tax=Lupinus angustifolius TaxID=3871 RepID=A0A1J7HAH6_LUPAN|nr:hypothetical protein TanjilG_24526 [Lupinus angustifolius]